MHDIELIKSLIAQGETRERVESDKFDANMIYIVFSDGEVSCTKAGSLLWQRSLHCFESGNDARQAAKELFPYRMSGYGFAYVAKREIAYAIHNAITGNDRKA